MTASSNDSRPQSPWRQRLRKIRKLVAKSEIRCLVKPSTGAPGRANLQENNKEMIMRNIAVVALGGVLTILSAGTPARAQTKDAPYGFDRHGKALRYPPGVEPGLPHDTFDKDLPTFWLIGDSTVKNGRENGREGGRWGWGDAIADYFEVSKINVENQALGGTSSRSFARDWWPDVLRLIEPGDFVMMQFGHNDGGIDSTNTHLRMRGSLPGNGDDTIEMEAPDGSKEIVHSYGWYIRKFITEARAEGATPIVCSLIPRNDWTEPHHMVRGQDDTYVQWAEDAARQEGTFFINLNHIIAQDLDPLRQDFALGTLYRTDDHTHTTLLGAQFNAHCVVSALKALGDACPLVRYLSPTAEPVEPTAAENVVLPAPK